MADGSNLIIHTSETSKKMSKINFWKIFYFWFLLTLLGSITAVFLSGLAQAHQKEIARHLYNAYRQSLPLLHADVLVKAQTDAIYYSDFRDQVVARNHIEDWTASLCDAEVEKENMLTRAAIIFLWPSGVLFFGGFLFTIFYFLSKLIEWIKKRKIEGVGLARLIGLIFAIICIVTMNIFLMREKPENSYFAAMSISDLASATYGSLIELSVEFYALDEAADEVSRIRKLEYIKNKAKESLVKIKGIQPIQHAGVVDFDGSQIINQTAEILQKIIYFTDTATSIAGAPLESQRNLGKSLGEFEMILDKLDGFIMESLFPLKPFSRYMLLMFSDAQKVRYETMLSNKDGNATYSMFIIFGFNLYKAIKENLQEADPAIIAELKFSNYGVLSKSK